MRDDGAFFFNLICTGKSNVQICRLFRGFTGCFDTGKKEISLAELQHWWVKSDINPASCGQSTRGDIESIISQIERILSLLLI